MKIADLAYMDMRWTVVQFLLNAGYNIAAGSPGESHFSGSMARFAVRYGKLLSDNILNFAPEGAFNLHGSLLP